ncbi:MAG: ABC transporter ATP-binding protein [Peptococcaceae bacterium]|jgi:putative ABC transport system ATP-binding protein|nr:ABC transporter ATP-binding protein [Peptococcaceae bacterium]
MLLETKGLTKIYERRGERFFAADSVDLRVACDDFVCITGSSGSGKSTLLNMLTGLLKADGGEILLEGEDICRLSDTALAHLRNSRLSYIPQGNSLLQNFSVLDNVCLPWYLTRRDDVKSRARELLGKVGIAHLEHESPRNLSGGESRRVAIARSLIVGPALLIADEPTGDLDPVNTDEVLRLFAEFHAQGLTVILVSHERQVPLCANRHLVMVNGRLVEGT